MAVLAVFAARKNSDDLALCRRNLEVLPGASGCYSLFSSVITANDNSER
jgi:hypothetical protein